MNLGGCPLILESYSYKYVCDFEDEHERKGNLVAFLTKLVKPKYNLFLRANNWIKECGQLGLSKGGFRDTAFGFILGRDAEFGHVDNPATRVEMHSVGKYVSPDFSRIWRKCLSTLLTPFKFYAYVAIF